MVIASRTVMRTKTKVEMMVTIAVRLVIDDT
jgi:hypothetical protein